MIDKKKMLKRILHCQHIEKGIIVASIVKNNKREYCGDIPFVEEIILDDNESIISELNEIEITLFISYKELIDKLNSCKSWEILGIDYNKEMGMRPVIEIKE